MVKREVSIYHLKQGKQLEVKPNWLAAYELFGSMFSKVWNYGFIDGMISSAEVLFEVIIQHVK